MSIRGVIGLVVAAVVALSLAAGAVGMPLFAQGSVVVSHAGSAGSAQGPVARVAACPGAPLPRTDCVVDRKTDCPVRGPEVVVAPLRCVPLQTPTLVDQVLKPPGGGCVENEYLQVKLVKGLRNFEAVWYWYNGFDGTRWFPGGLASIGPDKVMGEGGDSYKVPKGYAAWSVGGGASAAGHCSGPPPGTLGYAAWGIIANRYLVTGRVTDQDGVPVRDVDIKARCPSGDTFATDPKGEYHFLLDRGRCTIVPLVSREEDPKPMRRVLFVDHDFYNQDFVLHTDTISGHATDANGKPIADSQIDISGPTRTQVKTDARGDYGPVHVRPGRYTVAARFPLDRHSLRYKVLHCKVGAVSAWDCDAGLHNGKNLVADFRLGRPDVKISFDPDTVTGDGRGASNVTIGLTVDGQPVVDHVLVGVADAAAESRAGKPVTPPTFRSAAGLDQYAPERGLDGPAVIACAGDHLLGQSKRAAQYATDAHGQVHFRLFVGTNASKPISVDQAEIGPELRLTVTDIVDATPLPGFVQPSAILGLRSYKFASSRPTGGITVPTPDGLRNLATHVTPPQLTSSELTNQTDLLDWLTEAVTRSRGAYPPFGPIDGHLIGLVAPDDFAIYFGLKTGPNIDEQPGLDTAEATAIFGSGPLTPSLPTLATMFPATDLPFYPESEFLFYGFGIYPDPTTSDGRQLDSCAFPLVHTTAGG